MTVITAIITRLCTVHASDSFLTVSTDDERVCVEESEETKIVRVPNFAGIISYWGLATHPFSGWNTLDRLRRIAGESGRFGTAESFAQSLKNELTTEWTRMNLLTRPGSGLGLHFTAYENVGGRRVPELFRISNFVKTDYDSVFPDGFHCTRETFNQLTQDRTSLPEHANCEFRQRVYDHFLQQNGMLIFNNGDPVLFNPVAHAILGSLREIRARGALRDLDDVAMYREMAKLSIDLVSRIQEGFVQEERVPVEGEPRRFVLCGHRKIGGRRHALAVTPGGDYAPQSGD